MIRVFSFVSLGPGRLCQFTIDLSGTVRCLQEAHQCGFAIHTLKQRQDNLFMVILHTKFPRYMFFREY